MSFTGLFSDLSTLHRLSSAKTRSICPENPTGDKGSAAQAVPDNQSPARELGRGWKVKPCIGIAPGETLLMADISGPGAIQHIWLTQTKHLRHHILRIYWDGEETPSVEVPVCDFFALGWGRYTQISSLPVCVNPASALNCYWPMPFRKRAKVTMTNIGREQSTLFYQINYALADVPDDAAYFHAQFRRNNPLPYGKTHVLLDGVKGKGHYVGTYLAWGVNNNGWWGEGEVKFYMDGDGEFPTICGTGTEDYFCGSYNFDVGKVNGGYRDFSTPYTGFSVIRGDGLYESQQRFSMYRWHITDPVRFENDLKVDIQALGWRNQSGLYLPLQDDISSTAFWYQAEPHVPFPVLPSAHALETI